MRYLLLFLALSSCVTQPRRDEHEEFTASLKTWVGKTEDELVTAFGMPTKTHETPNGTRVLEFNSISARKLAVTGYAGSEVTAYDKYCKTTFVIGKTKTIESGSWEGNDCPKNADKPAGPGALDKLLGW